MRAPGGGRVRRSEGRHRIVVGKSIRNDISAGTAIDGAERRAARLPYPPPFQDLRTLSEHICAGESTIENWVTLGQVPEPKTLGGTRLRSSRAAVRHLPHLRETP